MSDKLTDLINNVKELIEDGTKSSQTCIKDIENQIDCKENQIRELFAENIDSVIAHYLQYHQTLFYHKKLEADCQEFSKHIEKAQKLNAYDQQQIQKTQKNLEQMKSIKTKLNQYKQYIRLAHKAAVNINQEKYNNAIKIINEYKKIAPKTETPLVRVLPLLEKKVQEYLRKLLQSFWEENKKKMLDIGHSCFQRMSSNLLQKLNIYQVFFGDNMSRSSLVNKNQISSFRCTVLQKQNSTRISKTSQDTQQYFNKMMVRVSVQMSTLKKVKLMIVQLNTQGIFNQMLRNSMREYLGNMEERYVCEKEEELVLMLEELIGLMLVKREVCAFFDVKSDERVFLNQTYYFIGRQIKSLSFIDQKEQSIVRLKEHLLIFHRILTILKLTQSNEPYNTIIKQMLKSYKTSNLSSFQSLSLSAIKTDNLSHYSCPNNPQKQAQIREMLDMGSQQFKFTQFVVFVLQYFMKTYGQMGRLIDQSDIKYQVVQQGIRQLYQKVLSVYGAQMRSRDVHFQIIQGWVNLMHIHKIYKYIQRQLSIYHGVITSNTMQDQYQQLTVQLTRNILQTIQSKLTSLLQDYNSMSSTHLNQSYNQFLQWSLQFVMNIVIFMKEINCPQYQSIAVQTMKMIRELFWEYLRGIKEINLVIIHNLDMDLSFIYKFCHKHFAGIITGMLDQFKSLRQFYALMLTNNINDLLDPQKRSLSYPNLDMENLIPMLKKYSQAKNTYGKIRELKKKDVENVVKKLSAPLK